MTLKTKERQDVQAKLTKAGLIAHVQAPNQYKDFEVEVVEGRPSNRLVIRPGKTDLKVFADPKNSQAILWVDEEERTETREVKAYLGYNLVGDALDERIEEVKRQWRRGQHFPLNLPPGTKYRIVEGPDTVPFDRQHVTGKVKAIIPKSELTLLVGKDETAHFVCALPERVKTVREAHEALRPADVPKGSPRQGEWFFVQATDEELEKIEAIVAKNPLNIQPYWLDASKYNRQQWWNTTTTHFSQSAILIGKSLFVTGFVLDDRTGRNQKSRHEPLWLHDWHRVVHNAEVDMGDAQADTWD